MLCSESASRLKGIETKAPTCSPLSKFLSSESASRLKGIETLLHYYTPGTEPRF